ncbi:MAG: NADH-quinone oxidoreductase subunit NuoH [Chloroflexi bacterium]|nr:NADH-quinone oxidoreductase subunit NuoH [Chloroflexota bacterium]
MSMLSITVDIDNAWLNAFLGMLTIVMLMTLVVLVLIYVERKFAARIQMRLGPMRVGPYGTLQTLADAVKLIAKEDLRPATADRWIFELAPFAIFVPTFLAFVAIPFTRDWAVSFLDLGLLYVVAVTGLSFIGFLMAGWASDNKYALLGGLRAAAQLISYEVPLVLALVAVSMVAGSLSLSEIVVFQGRVPLFVWQPLALFIFIAAALAELERQPFDIPTAESEVVGGPFIEYSGIRWSMFFLTSYASLFIYSLLGATVFLGGWNWPLGKEIGLGWQLVLIFAKTSFLILLFMWIRFTLPRLRIDQLMSFCWKVLVPLAFLQIFLNGLVLVYDWPDGLLLVTSGAGLALAGYIIYRAGRVEPRSVRLVPANPGLKAGATAGAGAETGGPA